ncbi:MAG: sporulation protein YabP [Symbiobacteriaceae bacterium]|nr:MAG: sporulation protein YabP [Bacillota bacterium]
MSEGQGAGGARGRHTLMMTGRERLELEGVQRVDSFDDKAVVLDTDLGRMTIRGENLHIHELNLEDGRLLLEGRITSLAYEDTGSGRRERRNLLERLLK